jgi:ADP-heptose:LPS heptosyltransferase
MHTSPSRIIIFRFGSIGDFVISLPCFHLIRAIYPLAKIALLTNQSGSSRTTQAASVLEGTGLVDEYFSYIAGTRSISELMRIRSDITAFGSDFLVYLAAPRGIMSVYRDYLFFRWCGLRSIVGLPAMPKLWKSRPPLAGGAMFESEAQRLARNLSALGSIDITRSENWNLHLSDNEIKTATEILDKGLPVDQNGRVQFLVLSIGTKQGINDWGDRNWAAVIKEIAKVDVGLVFVGSLEDRERSEELARLWPGPTVNLCGKASPRVSAAIIGQSILFLGHDSGPMHLAAAVGIRCIAVFSRRNHFGIWCPFGSFHHIVYPPWRRGTIQSIGPSQVAAATLEMLGA